MALFAFLSIPAAAEYNALYQKQGYVVANIFFGGWLFPLGYLVFKSGFFPKTLGVLLMLAAFGYLIPFFTAFLLPNYEVIAFPGLIVAVIAEVSFCLWLLIKGVKVEQWEKRALESV